MRFAAIIVMQEQPSAATLARVTSWANLVSITSTPLEFESGSADTPAILIYTSGSTGEPHGILYTQAQVLNAAWAIIDALGGGSPNDRFLAWLPVSQTFQRMMNICSLCVGAPTAILSEPHRILMALRSHRPTILAA